jgi:hypothetical protein
LVDADGRIGIAEAAEEASSILRCILVVKPGDAETLVL